MSRIRANKITNQLADGSPTVEKGLIISGVTTSTTFSGSGASLTNLPAAQLSGTAAAINGSNITNLNASNIASGTVPTARLGSGTASSSTFLRGDSTFQTVNTDLVSDTSPQLGGNLDTNSKNIVFGDSSGTTVNRLTFGGQADMKLFHDGTNSVITNATGDLYINNNADTIIKPANDCFIKPQDGENGISVIGNGAVELYHNNSKKFETSSSGATVTGTLTATSFVPTDGQLSHRNIIINGAMLVAQRTTDVTDATAGYHTVDRIQSENLNADEAPRRQQVDVSSSSTPYTLGFRKAYKLTNGNQTGSNTGDIMNIRYKIEGQDIANSGWNYTSSTSYITLQFWIKSSVSQNFQMYVRSRSGTNQSYAFDTGTLSADTWTKVIKTIPGNSNIQIDNTNAEGFQLNFGPFWGTDRTTNSTTNEVWQAFSSGTRMRDNATTWYTTDNATLEITGIQLEVGSVATPFEHRSYAEELLRCKRYYQRSTDSSRGSNYSLASSSWHSADGVQSFCKHNNYYDFKERFEVEMRVAPTLTIYGSSNQGDIHIERVAVGSQQVDWNNNTTEVKTKGFLLRHIEDSYGTSGSGNGFGILAYTVDAEL